MMDVSLVDILLSATALMESSGQLRMAPALFTNLLRLNLSLSVDGALTCMGGGGFRQKLITNSLALLVFRSR